MTLHPSTDRTEEVSSPNRPSSTSRRRCLAALGSAATFGGLASAAGSTGAAAQSGATSALAGQDWELVWSDEFEDGIDDDTWSFAVGNGHAEGIPGWGNEESQYYTDGDNARIEDGSLVIEAREEQVSDRHGSYDYTSSRMLTAGKRQFQYGRLDVTATLPEGQGIWPAIWLLGSDIDQVGWPDCGEIDVMELLGDRPSTVHGTVHGPGYSAGQSIGGDYHLDAGTFADGAHTFSIVREPDRIDWYVDGEQFFSVTRADVEARGAEWVFDGPCYLLLNVAVGGQWPGYPDETTTFPQRMVVDHVREYAPVEAPTCGDTAAANTAAVEGQTVCDLDGDDLYMDVNGDGSLDHSDVVHFFQNQHTPAWNERTDLFDFSGSQSVGHGDVVELFQHVSSQL